MTATMYIGDVLDVLGKLPENSVDLVLSSPPFLALRSYLPADHPLKEKEGGSQSTPGEYIDWLLDVVEACDRVLAPHGSLCFELGDTYSGSGGGGGDYLEGGWREGQAQFAGSAASMKESNAAHWRQKNGQKQAWPLPKSLTLIPESFRFAMVYGFNPFTGRQTERWRLRNVIRWVRPNPPVGALGDKFRPATSELMVFCKSAKRYFDLDAVREPFRGDGVAHGSPSAELGQTIRKASDALNERALAAGSRRMPVTMNTQAGAPPLDWWNIPLLEGEDCETCGGTGLWTSRGATEREFLEGLKEEPCPSCHGSGKVWNEEPTPYGPKDRDAVIPKRPNPKQQQMRDEGVVTHGVSIALADATYNKAGGAPPLDWWEIAPGGFSGAHYAVWPPELLIKPIKAMCPEQVCRTCGEARRRIVGEAEYVNAKNGTVRVDKGGTRRGQGLYEGNREIADGSDQSVLRIAETLGFTDCGHDDYRPGLVLDPFVGSGTTLSVATGHGRDAIGIDLDERNFDLALERVGPLVLQRGEVAA